MPYTWVIGRNTKDGTYILQVQDGTPEAPLEIVDLTEDALRELVLRISTMLDVGQSYVEKRGTAYPDGSFTPF